jgi:two-component system LytT family response regulator
VRVHRSVILNLERIARIEPYGKESRIAILMDGTRLPVSRAGYARLLDAMGDSQGNRSTTR